MNKRPIIMDYLDPVKYLTDMILFRKKTDRAFSILKMSKKIPRCSPALISLILKGKRNITPERVEVISQILALSIQEKQYFKDWIFSKATGKKIELTSKSEISTTETNETKRVKVSSHLLTDWLNVYVKDAFQMEEIQNNPHKIFSLLGHVSSHARIEKSISFLIKHQYLIKDPKGKIHLNAKLVVANQNISDEKIKIFHKKSLLLAKDAIDHFSISERQAQALILPLDQHGYESLLKIIADFSEKLQSFSENYKPNHQERLYQILINLSPTGGKL